MGQHGAVSYDARHDLIWAPPSSRVRNEAHRLGPYHRIRSYLPGRDLAAGAVVDDALLLPALRGAPSAPILPEAADQVAGAACPCHTSSTQQLCGRCGMSEAR